MVSIENVSKLYRLGQVNTGTYYGDIKRWWASARGLPDPFYKIGDPNQDNHDNETIWALKDVNFSVQQGEVIGIVGRNGAGKSTLLKILSRVTAPTSGSVKFKGRIVSLLEVGTGFHPELTGRENVFLNSAILGMDRRETQRRFDEIVDFSGVEKFIDTPVKHYSSGMYIRLAFSVSAFLDPDILVLDEVLAVGDVEFQRKSYAKMRNAAQAGRTILLVTHGLNLLTLFCSRAIILNKGVVQFDGDTAEAVKIYSNTITSVTNGTSYEIDFTKEKKVGDEYATLLEGHIEDENGKPSGRVSIKSGFKVKMRYQLHNAPDKSAIPNFHFYNSLYQCVFMSSVSSSSNDGIYEATCIVPGDFLNDDTYYVGLAMTFLHDGVHVSFFERDILSVVVYEPLHETLDKERQGFTGGIPGVIRPKLDWKVEIVK
jgi:lipopolysaccharide transport system ATP-binding protein